MKKIFRATIGLLCLGASQATAQFNINETFKNSTISSGITLGGSAVLTSGTADLQGQGWLRLTGDINNQAGYAVIEEAFPSAMGVLIDFEYTTWSRPGAGSGADGISLFLFDANHEGTFHAGGYGGSLGYSKRTDAAGLTAGYMGIGLDEFGNYSNPTEGRVGGPGFIKNAVALRGPAPSYAYLGGQQVITSDNGNGDNGGIDYNTTISSRPTSNQFYRRVQISLEPHDGTYTVTVKWKKNPTSPFTTLFGPVTMTSPPPAMLKLGLAASTGSQHNFHEIRNMIITTPGNISVDKQGPDYITAGSNGSSALDYDITVSNQTAIPVNNIQISDLLPANYTVDLDTGITIDDFGDSTNAITNLSINNGILSGLATVAANSEVRLRLRGTINNLTPGQSIRNTVHISTTSIQDADTTNNADTVFTLVQVPLPVTLIDFKAAKQGEDVLLEWKTAMEINSDYFEVERSTDGKQFTAIGKIKGEGDTHETRHYSFVDHQASEQQASALYYRLKQVDHDGKHEYSSVRMLALTNNNEVNIYPVPFHNDLHMQLYSKEAANGILRIYSIDGRMLYHYSFNLQKGYNQINLDQLPSLPNGTLLLEVQAGTIIHKQKLIKQ